MPHPTPQQSLAQAQTFITSGRLAEAEAILRRLLQSDPKHPDLLNHTGLLCYRQGKLDEAERLIRAAIASNGSSSQFHVNLGSVFLAQRKPVDAAASFRRAIAVNPNDAMAYFNLGVTLRLLNFPDEAIDAYQQAVRLKPDDARALNNLASSLRAQGRIAEAVACFRKCLAVLPTAECHSNLVYAMWFDPAATPQEIVAEHGRFAQRWAAPLAPQIPTPKINPPNPRLRIGYVSPDFRQHVIALFMRTILHHRDRSAFEVFCYADVPNSDFMTDRIKAETDVWVDTARLSDADLAARIRADRIDILVDLTAHMARNRMLVFARKPAPVQVSYLAYAGTTGLPAMDYRISDVYLDPPEVSPTLGSERVVRLPETYWCYQPQISVPEVSTRAIIGGKVTFACYNAAAKINPPAIAVWARTLKELPGSRLRLIIPGGQRGNGHLLQMFTQQGIGPGQVELHDKVGYESYFPLYNDADIALDPFPYNGGTTTLDALYMGLPVITLAGSSGMSRAGVSILTNVGMPGLIAQTPEEYVRLAIELARDAGRLTDLRGSLRQRLINSPLMNAPRFVGDLEAAYRMMQRG